MAENLSNASKQLTDNALSSIENIKFLAEILLHSVHHRPSEKMLTWLARKILLDAGDAEAEICKFKA